jgi:lipase chaperone LimK
MRRVASAAALLAVIAACAALALFVGRAAGGRLPSGSRTWEHEQRATISLSGRPDRGESGVRQPALSTGDEAPALPASLTGTDVDGALGLGADGRFCLDRAARRLFDYFLSAAGELDRAAIRRLVAAQAAAQLPGHEEEVLDGFDRYLGYLDDAAAATAASSPGTDLHDHLATLSALQVARFGDEVAARLFGDDDALAAAILDASDLAGELAGRTDLSPAEREAAAEAIDARLPARLREARARMRAPALVRAQVEAARAAGAGEAEIWALRARAFGSDAADRLAARDRRR